MQTLSLDTWVSLGALAGAFALLFGYLRTELAAIERGLTGVRTELTTAIGGLRTELKADIAEVRTELKADIAEVRTELKTDIAEVRTELKADIAEVRKAVATLDERVYHLNTSVTGLLVREESRSSPT